jgi:hypothetical protein
VSEKKCLLSWRTRRKNGALKGGDERERVRLRWIVDRPARNEKSIFMAALDHEPGAERVAYLDAACGENSELRRRIEALLAAYERADEVLGAEGHPVTRDSNASRPIAEERRA